MKKKTYNNVLKAGKLIQKKGYSEKESLEIAINCFDQLAEMKNNMSVEWLINQLATKKEWEEGHKLWKKKRNRETIIKKLIML